MSDIRTRQRQICLQANNHVLQYCIYISYSDDVNDDDDVIVKRFSVRGNIGGVEQTTRRPLSPCPEFHRG